MAYEFLGLKYVDLSALGFGDNLMVEYDKETGKVRISVFDNSHYQDHTVVDLKKIFDSHIHLCGG